MVKRGQRKGAFHDNDIVLVQHAQDQQLRTHDLKILHPQNGAGLVYYLSSARGDPKRMIDLFIGDAAFAKRPAAINVRKRIFASLENR